MLKLDGEPFTEEEITEFRTIQQIEDSYSESGKRSYDYIKEKEINKCVDEKIDNVRPEFNEQCEKEIGDKHEKSSIKIQAQVREKQARKKSKETKNPTVVDAEVVDGTILVNNDMPVATAIPIPDNPDNSMGGKRRRKSRRRRQKPRKSRRRRQKSRKSRRRRKSKKTKRRRRRK